MPPRNEEVAAAFRELADLLEITAGDRFRVLAYRRVADVVGGLGRDVAGLSEAELTTLRGVGRATAEKIREFAETGTMGHLLEMRAAVPSGVREMTRLPGLGPKKAMLICRELQISTIEELKDAIEARRLRGIPGLGAKTEENLLRAIAQHSASERRILLGMALSLAEEMLEALRQEKAVEEVSYAGSLRRMKETIGDLDLLAASHRPGEVREAFGRLPQVERVAASGPTKSSVITKGGLQVDLRVVAPDSYGAALQYFTGSKEHNVKVREHAVRMGLKLSEYGLFRVASGERVAAETEEQVYAALGMQTPPPPMRENRGEVELALRGQLPVVVEVADLQGDLHGHSTYSDGRASISEMASAAAGRSYRYWAVTDHGRDLHLKSLSIQDVHRQAEEVRRLNAAFGGRITILHGVEANIGPEGGLDYPDEILARFDVVVASVHHHLRGDRDAMTRRVLRAIEHPRVHIIGHPTGRRLPRRPPYELDLEAVCRAAAAHGVALEINSNPERLDLKDDHILLARDYGCLFAVDSDAHRPRELDLIRFGVFTAQRGWLVRERVINTWPLPRLRRFLSKRNSP